MWKRVTKQNAQIIISVRDQIKDEKEYLDQLLLGADMCHYHNSWEGGRCTNSDFIDAIRRYRGSEQATIIAIQIMKIQELEKVIETLNKK